MCENQPIRSLVNNVSSCNICSSTIIDYHVLCSLVEIWFHQDCTILIFDELINMDTIIRYKCKKRLSVFQFHATDDDELIASFSNIDNYIDENEQYNENSRLFFCVFNHINENHLIFYNIDPDSYSFDSVGIDCNHFTYYQFLKTFNIHQGLSMAHFNCRSLLNNFDKISIFLYQLR